MPQSTPSGSLDKPLALDTTGLIAGRSPPERPLRRVSLKVRPEGDESNFSSAIYEYPQHLRDAISDLPAAPGVYVFHGETGDLPLYIGKSVNLRNRVLSHLRTVDEARMLRQIRRIEHIRTAGEIGALLLEAQLIKQRLPLFNQNLRRNRQLCAWQWNDPRLEVVHANRLNFATEPRLFGLFGSRQAAIESLMNWADEHRLCLGVLGLEKRVAGKPCFRHMVNRCAGARCGREDGASHGQRLLAALQGIQVSCWPYPGPVALKEICPLDASFVQFHVVRNWCYLGSVACLAQARALDTVAAGFDADGYKILYKPVLLGQVEVIRL
jgi:excinuclease Cho